MITKKTAAIIKWSSIVVLAISILLLMRALPMEQITKALGQWTDSLGIWGPVVFALVYIVATVFLVPGSVLTLAAGAIFGLWIGFITVSFGSVVGAAFAFLISRYVARSKVDSMAKSNRKFAAIDAAIDEGGWKIVGMLRLSPAIPFNLQNYLFGLTSIKFWQYVLTSWIAMIPGTFMYVYLGHAAGTAASGEGKSIGEWALLGVGLMATIAVTVYITKLAKRKLDEQTELKEADGTDDTEQEADTDQPSTWKTYAFGLATAAILAVAIFAQFERKAIASYLLSAAGGPPVVTMAESYSEKPNGPMFDHGTWSKLLDQFVVDGGWVDYAGLKQEPQLLEDYIAQLKQSPFDELGRDQKLALLINAYNAFTLKLIIDHYPIESIKDIPAAERWDAKRWTVGAHQWSLSQIEHEQIRPNFKEPRIHFALVCAAVGCPPLAEQSYKAQQLDEQLQRQAEVVHSHETWLQINDTDGLVAVTSIYDWYADDFEQSADTVLQYISQHSSAVASLREKTENVQVEFLDYDWSLNSVENKRPR